MGRFGKIIKKFPRIFWISNTLELFERWAWYGFYMGLSFYLIGSKDEGALGFTPTQMGLIMGTGSMLLYFLPTITGAISDKIGFKKVLIISFIMYISGFFMMGYFESYQAIFISFIYVAIAGALFKPIIAGTIAKVTDDETSSIGFGIYYMMINIGGFLGPLFAGIFKKISWDYVFAISMIAIALNYLIVLLFYKDTSYKKVKESLKETIKQSFNNILYALSDFKYLIFLFLMIGFWTTFNQLYYTFPVFLEQWADTSNLFDSLQKISLWLASQLGENGSITTHTMTSLDAFFIILFQLVISTFVMRFKPLNSIISGLLILSFGVGLMFASQNGWFLLLGLFIFSIGEMASSPKFTEYVGKIAPPDKVALYLGTSFIPIGFSHIIAGLLTGSVYGKLADKVFLLQQEVAERGLDVPEIGEGFTQNDYFNRAGELMGMDQLQLTDYLWQTYDPSQVMYIFAGIGIATAVLLLLYDKLILKSKNNNNKN